MAKSKKDYETLPTGEKIEQKKRQLKQLFKDLPPEKKQFAEGLIQQFATTAVTLERLAEEINNGEVIEDFIQGAQRLRRENPALKSYNATIKSFATLALAAAYCQALVLPVALLGVAMACDYFSGVAAAWITNKLSSRVGIVGIIKKVGYALLVVVGIVVDWVIHYAAEMLGWPSVNFYYFGLLVTVWITLNECISITENVARMGVKVPSFLQKVIEKLKCTTEKKGEEPETGDTPKK